MTDAGTAKTAVRHDWADIPADHPVHHISRQLVVGERMMVGRMIVEEGFDIPPHVHPNEQISIVVEGSVIFRVADVSSSEFREVLVSAGQVMELPPHVPHGVRALEHSVVFDLFSPPSEKTGLDSD